MTESPTIHDSSARMQRNDAPSSALNDVELRDVSKRFGDVWALRPTHLAVRHGEFFSLLGSSGSGKTTTLRIIAGFEEPTSGTIELQGKDVTLRAPYERNVNTVFQDYALFPHMTVEDNIGYGLRVRRVPKIERRRRVGEALELVRLGGFGSRRPGQLSGGQRQRVALARALVNMPAVLLLDEPLGALDLKLRREMQSELKQIQRDVGITFIYVTHDQEEAMSMSDRIAVMTDGEIVQIGAPTDVYERPASAFIAGFVGVSNVFRGAAQDGGTGLIGIEFPGADRLLAPRPAHATIGADVVATVRPEKIAMAARPVDAASRLNLLHGTISDVSYGGAFTRYSVTVFDHEIMVIDQNQTGGPRADLGEEVWLTWPIEQTYVLPGSEEDLRRGQGVAVSADSRI